MASGDADLSKLFELRNGQSIVDIKISNTQAQADLYQELGYHHIIPEGSEGNNFILSGGTFGRKQNLWIWRRDQGTFSGRLKPIIDIILDTSHT